MRILLIGRPDTILNARWLQSVILQGWDVHLFAVTSTWPHPALTQLTLYRLVAHRPATLHPTIRLRGLWPFPRGRKLMQRLAPASWQDPARWLARIIRWLKPDVIHSLEISAASLLTLTTHYYLQGKHPPWIVSNWQNDWYHEPFTMARLGQYITGSVPNWRVHSWNEEAATLMQLAHYVPQVQAMLSACTAYHSEYQSDVESLKMLGFSGKMITQKFFNPNYLPAAAQAEPPARRRVILLRGEQDSYARALVGLRAIALCSDILEDYRVVIYMANPDVQLAAEVASLSMGKPIEVVPPHDYEDYVQLHTHARVAIELSTSDKMSTLFPDTLVMGAFPICSALNPAREWVQDGENGLLVHPEEPQEVAAALRQALTNDALVTQAAARHYQAAVDSRERIRAMYQELKGQRGGQ